MVSSRERGDNYNTRTREGLAGAAAREGAHTPPRCPPRHDWGERRGFPSNAFFGPALLPRLFGSGYVACACVCPQCRVSGVLLGIGTGSCAECLCTVPTRRGVSRVPSAAHKSTLVCSRELSRCVNTTHSFLHRRVLWEAPGCSGALITCATHQVDIQQHPRRTQTHYVGAARICCTDTRAVRSTRPPPRPGAQPGCAPPSAPNQQAASGRSAG